MQNQEPKSNISEFSRLIHECQKEIQAAMDDYRKDIQEALTSLESDLVRG